MSYYIRTQFQDTYVGSEGKPEMFETRGAARLRADELADSTPSSYGKLIVSLAPPRLSERAR